MQLHKAEITLNQTVMYLSSNRGIQISTVILHEMVFHLYVFDQRQLGMIALMIGDHPLTCVLICKVEVVVRVANCPQSRT